MLRQELREHLTGKILPFWEGLKDEAHGGFYGYVDKALNIEKKADKGCILHSRILWTFSTAARQLRSGEYRAYADWAYEALKKFEDGEHGGVWWSITYDGKPADTESRKKIAYLPTDPFFYNWMTAEDVGRYYQDFFDDFSEEKYREMLSQMELTENLRVKNLSSGMTAKLKIAVTMARNAEIYLLDEPLNGIDLLARDRIMEAIIRSSGPDVAMIISSHLVEEIESFVNRVIFVRQGRIVEQADTEELRQTRNVSLTDRYRALMAGVSEQ